MTPRFSPEQLTAAKSAFRAFWSPKWMAKVPSEDRRIGLYQDYCIGCCENDRQAGLQLAKEGMVS